MKQSINEYQFTQAFVDMNRTENFTYDARKALFSHFESIEEDTGEEIELDVIAICCEYSEFSTAVEAATESGWEAPEAPEHDEDATEEEIEVANEEAKEEAEAEALAWLQDHTTVIEFDGGIVIQGF